MEKIYIGFADLLHLLCSLYQKGSSCAMFYIPDTLTRQEGHYIYMQVY